MKNRCVNCGQHEADNMICDPCRQSFPGDPAILEEIVRTFKNCAWLIPGGFLNAPLGTKEKA